MLQLQLFDLKWHLCCIISDQNIISFSSIVTRLFLSAPLKLVIVGSRPPLDSQCVYIPIN